MTICTTLRSAILVSGFLSLALDAEPALTREGKYWVEVRSGSEPMAPSTRLRVGCGISNLRNRTATGIRVVLWPGFFVDLICPQRRGRLFNDAHRSRLHQQIPAGRWQSATRNFAKRESGAVVQGLSLRVRFCRRDSAVHHRRE